MSRIHMGSVEDIKTSTVRTIASIKEILSKDSNPALDHKYRVDGKPITAREYLRNALKANEDLLSLLNPSMHQNHTLEELKNSVSLAAAVAYDAGVKTVIDHVMSRARLDGLAAAAAAAAPPAPPAPPAPQVLQARYAGLLAAYKRLDADKTTLQGVVDNYRDLLKRADADKTALQGVVDNLRDLLKRADADKTALQGVVDNLRNEVARKQDPELLQAKIELALAKQELKYMKELQGLRTDLAEKSAEMEHTRAESERKSAEIERLKVEIERLKVEIKRLRAARAGEAVVRKKGLDLEDDLQDVAAVLPPKAKQRREGEKGAAGGETAATGAQGLFAQLGIASQVKAAPAAPAEVDGYRPIKRKASEMDREVTKPPKKKRKKTLANIDFTAVRPDPAFSAQKIKNPKLSGIAQDLHAGAQQLASALLKGEAVKWDAPALTALEKAHACVGRLAGTLMDSQFEDGSVADGLLEYAQALRLLAAVVLYDKTPVSSERYEKRLDFVGGAFDNCNTTIEFCGFAHLAYCVTSLGKSSHFARDSKIRTYDNLADVCLAVSALEAGNAVEAVELIINTLSNGKHLISAADQFIHLFLMQYVLKKVREKNHGFRRSGEARPNPLAARCSNVELKFEEWLARQLDKARSHLGLSPEAGAAAAPPAPGLGR